MITPRRCTFSYDASQGRLLRTTVDPRPTRANMVDDSGLVADEPIVVEEDRTQQPPHPEKR
jgi:hypothetical protein